MGLVKAEQVLVSAKTRRMARNTILVAAASAGGYLLAMSFYELFKR
jgi:hypothetical protein